MKKIGFIGAYDKTNLIMYIAKALQLLGNRVLVIDASDIQKIKYVVPAINPTKAYITCFEKIDFAVGFEEWEQIEKYLGMRFDTNDEIDLKNKKKNKNGYEYDYVLVSVDNTKTFDSFEMENSYKNYFVTAFDMFSLKKGIDIFKNLETQIKLTRIFYIYDESKEDEDYLNYISLEYKINWENYSMYFQILGADNKVFEENQRLEKIRFKRLSQNYKDSLAYIIQDINKNESLGKIKKIMKD